MPGYILHLTSARLLLNRLAADSPYRKDPEAGNLFYIGNLLPDAAVPKKVSHFYDPAFLDRMVVWPRPEEFRKKYCDRMEDPLVRGYYYHLYIDKKFLKEYLPEIVEYYDREGNPADRKSRVDYVRIKRTKEKIALGRYLSEEYYYGDYTKMNTWLWKRYELPENLSSGFIPECTDIQEAQGADLKGVLRELEEYKKVPEDAVNDVRVFDVKKLLLFLEDAAAEAAGFF